MGGGGKTNFLHMNLFILILLKMVSVKLTGFTRGELGFLWELIG